MLLLVLVLAAGGCRHEQANAGFRVALLSPGPISDAGWNAAAYDGLLAIRDQLGAEVSQVETRTPPEFEEAFRDYARRGFQVVIGHGFEFHAISCCNPTARSRPGRQRSIAPVTSLARLRN